MNVKSLFKPIWRLEGRISEYIALILRARAFGLSSAPLQSQGRYFQSIKVSLWYFSAWDTLHKCTGCRWSDMFCDLYTCDLFRSVWRWPAETCVIWVRVLFPPTSPPRQPLLAESLNFIWCEVFWQQLKKVSLQPKNWSRGVGCGLRPSVTVSHHCHQGPREHITLLIHCNGG